MNSYNASKGWCYSYVWEVNELHRDHEAKKAAEEQARQEVEARAKQQAFENAVRCWAEEELTEDNYLQFNLVEVGLEFEILLNNYK